MADPRNPKSGEEKEESARFQLAKKLADNDVAIRSRAVKLVRHWLQKRKSLGDLDLLKLWKGLFYCM